MSDAAPYVNRFVLAGCRLSGDQTGGPCWLIVGPGLCGGIYCYDLAAGQTYCNRRFLNPADINDDGVCNSQDFFDYLAAFYAGPGDPAWCKADWVNDGVIDTADFFGFMADFSGAGQQ